MDVRLAFVDLSEARQLLVDFSRVAPVHQKQAQSALELDLLVERKLRAGKQTHGDVRLLDGGKAARDRTAELDCLELVSNLCGPGSDTMQAVVAHALFFLVGQPP